MGEIVIVLREVLGLRYGKGSTQRSTLRT